MSDIFIDPISRSLIIEKGDIKLTPTFRDTVKQRLEIRLNTFRGEWDFNILFGVPYIENDNNPVQILGKTNPEIFESYIREAISEVEGIDEITSFTSNINERSRTISIDFQCKLIDENNLSINQTINL